MKIVDYTKSLYWALSLFVLTVAVHGGMPCLEKDAKEDAPLTFCGFRIIPSSGDSPLQTILDYVPDGRNFIRAVKDWKFLQSATYLDPNTPLHINVTLDDSADISTLLDLEAVCIISRLTVHNMGTHGAENLAKVLPALNKLQYFDLLGDEIGPDGKKITSIHDIDIMRNSIGTNGVIVLAKSLALLTNLRHLAIRNCSFDSDGSKALAPSLALLTNLQYLDLSGNDIRTTGAKALTKSLALLTNLETLNLSWNFICDNGVIALATVLELLTNLKHLNLSINPIGPIGTKILVKSLALLTNLQYLDLSAICNNRFNNNIN